ncbi:hypothetical protein ACNQR7_31185 [Mycolicibacterium senegalense]|uniref:hypothetical protein n=1 Tax=Mycobacteriaceae TaxID=1762 RepID=UPI003AAB18AB
MTADSEMDAAVAQFAAARAAREVGAAVFTPVVSLANTEETARVIGTIEAAGWRLANWAVAVDKHGQPLAYPVFRPVVAGGMMPA